MRKLIELAMVFLLGWALAWYFIGGNNRDNNRDNQPVSRQSEPSKTITQPFPAEPILPQNPAARTPGTSNALEKANRLLAQGDIDGFMESLGSVKDDMRAAMRAALFHALQQLKSNQQYRTAVDWLTAYLQTEYDDVIALQALAEFHYLMGNYLAAIDTLYQAKSYAHENNKIEQIVTAQRAITAEYANQLKSNDDHLGLLDLYQSLVSAEPEYSAHYIGLAEAYLALGNEAGARDTLNIIAYDPEVKTKVHQLLSLLDEQAAKAVESTEPVELTRQGNNLLAEVLFNNRLYGRLLLDTGASLTVITPQMLQELSIDYRSPVRTAWFNTANGVVEAPIFVVERVSIDGYNVDRLEVAVMDLGGQHINGLLGMNFLRHFRFSIDQRNKVLYLSPRT